MQGYDVIGDVHGSASQLEALLQKLGYEAGASDEHRHPDRQAIFVGDLIDRGSEQLRVLEVVKTMVDGDSARIVMGNHEFNALAYATEWPPGSGKYLRPHGDQMTRGRRRAPNSMPPFSTKFVAKTVAGTWTGSRRSRCGWISANCVSCMPAGTTTRSIWSRTAAVRAPRSPNCSTWWP